jgi:very-short-patch-repair endonuclease
LPELQRFVWEWTSLLDRLRRLNPRLEEQIGRSARPIAAERRPDGRLLLVLGCWVPADRAQLAEVDTLQRIEDGLKTLLDERISVLITEWPGGDGEPGDPPDPLGGLSESLRAIGLAASGALHRAFFAAAARRGIVFETGVPVLQYRLDFALPRQRLGVEIEGWNWRAWARPGAAEWREREQSLGAEGWTILWFTGEEILHHRDRAVDDVAAALARRRSNGRQA